MRSFLSVIGAINPQLALGIGDKVITTAGIHGKIVGSNETTFLIEVEGGTKIRFDKSAISLDATKAAVAPSAAKA